MPADFYATLSHGYIIKLEWSIAMHHKGASKDHLFTLFEILATVQIEKQFSILAFTFLFVLTNMPYCRTLLKTN